MADKEFLDLVVRLKGEFKELEKLQKGLDIKVRLDFDKSSGGGFAKLEKLKKGLDINVNLNIKGLDKLEELKKGITIPIKMQGEGKSSKSKKSKGTLDDYMEQEQERLEKAYKNFLKRRKDSIAEELIPLRAKNAKELKERQDFERSLEKIAEGRQKAQQKRSQLINQLVNKQNKSNASQARQRIKNQDIRTLSPQELGLLSKGAGLFDQIFALQKQQGYIDSLGRYNESPGAVTKNVPLANVKGKLHAFNQQQLKNKQDDVIFQYQNALNFGGQLGPKPPGPSGPFSNINQPQLDREKFIQDRADDRRRRQQYRENLRRARENRFRNRINRERAQEELDLIPSFANFDEARERIAYNRGLLPGDLRAGGPSRTGIAKLTKGFIDPRRLKDAGRERGFATLFGAQSGFGHAGVLGGLLGGLGGFAGSTIGGAINGHEGAFIGATGVEVGLQVFFRAFESVKEKLIEVSQAGLQFEESILGISSVLQATTTVRGPGGKSLGVGEQLKFQEGRAREIQLQARKKLLPLGIGGETEAALVQGLITGFAQKGIQLSSEQVATLASRVGGAIQAQRPDLLQNTNRLRLEVEDSISNPGRNTALTPVLRAFAPSLGKATSGEEALKFTTGLEPFPQALTSNTDNVVQAIRQFNTEIENLKVTFGSDFLRGLTPAIKEFTETLKNSEVQDSLKTLSSSLAQFFSFIITSAAGIANAAGQLQKNKGAGRLGGDVGAISGAVGGAVVGGKIGSIIPGVGILLGGALGGAIGGIGGFAAGRIAGLNAETAQINQKNKELLDQLNTKAEGNTSQTSASTIINSLLGGESGVGGEAGFRKATLAKRFLGLRDQEQRENLLSAADKIKDEKEKAEFIKSIDFQVASGRSLVKEQISGGRLSGFRDLFNRKRNLFDIGTASGNASKSAFDISGFEKEQQLLQERKALKEKEIKGISSELANAPTSSKKDLNFLISQETKLLDAREQLANITDEAVTSTNNLRNSIRGLLDSFSTREAEVGATFNENTLVGQGQALNLRDQRISAERSKLASFRGNLSSDEFNRRNLGLDKLDIQNRDAKEIQGFTDAESFLNVEQSLKDFSNLQTNLNNTLEGYQLSLEDAEAATRSASLAQESASLADKNLAREKESFIADFQLRRLGEQGKAISLEEQNVAAGGNAGDLGLGVDISLIKGSSTFNQQRRNQFERDFIREQANSLERDISGAPGVEADKLASFDIQGQENALSADAARRSAERASISRDSVLQKISGFDIESAQAEVGALKSLAQLKQILPEGAQRDKLEEQLSGDGVKSVLEKNGFKDFAQFEEQLKKDREVAPGQFKDQTNPITGSVSSGFDETLNSINTNVEAILNSLVKPAGSENNTNPRFIKGKPLAKNEQIGSDILSGLLGVPNTNFAPKDFKPKNAIGSDILGALLDSNASNPQDNLKSAIEQLSYTPSPEASKPENNDNPISFIAAALENLASIMSNNPKDIGTQVQSALRSSFSGQ